MPQTRRTEVAGMIVAVMICAVTGHTERALAMSRLLLGLSISVLCTVVRTLAPALNAQCQNALTLSAASSVRECALVLGKIGR